MSEKVTFQELIESIAEQTDHSRQSTHDFLKDFVAVINGGLESDGAINIAGFGKFKLRSMKEREGYNPKTKEKITIPARKKVVFKPYKALRELVNTPYAHLDPELIDDTADGDAFDTGKQEEKQQSVHSEPPVSPQPDNKEDKSEATPEKPERTPWEELPDEAKSQPVQEDDPFGFGRPETHPSILQPDEYEENENDDDDIVEYSPDIKTEQQGKAERIAALIAERKKSLEQDEDEKGSDIKEDVTDKDKDSALDDEESALKETFRSEDDEILENFSSREPEAPGREEPQHSIPPPPSHQQPNAGEQQQSKSSIRTMVWVAAACIALLLAAGAWYYYTAMNNSKPYYAIAAEAAQQTDNVPQQRTSSPDRQTYPGRQALPASSTTNRQDDISTGNAAKTQQKAGQKLVITRGQTLWSLADQQYDDPYLWPWIYGENKTSIGNPDLILAGQTLALPVPDEANGGLSIDDSLQVAIGYVDTYRWYKNNGYEKAKYYLYAATIYNGSVFNFTDVSIDKADLAFANRVR